MLIRISTLALLFILHCFSEANAQEEDLILTYEEAVNIALRENIQIKQQENILETNRAERSAAYAQFAPSVGISASLNRQYGIFFDNVADTLVNGKTDGMSGGISAEYPIFNGFARIHQVKRSQNALEAQYHQINQAKQDVMFNVSQQYLQVLLNQELLRIAKANLEQQNELAESIKTFVDTGTRNIADQYNQEAEAKRAALQVVEAENNLTISKVQLIRTLQIDPFKNWVFTEPEVVLEEETLTQTNLENMYNQAIASRPDIKQQKSLIIANRYGVKVAKSNFYPSLTMSYSYGSSYTSNNPIDFRTQVTEFNDTHFIGLSLFVPIFNNLQTRVLVQRSKLLLDNAVLDLEDLERGVLEQLQTALAGYKTAQERIIAAEAQVRAAEKALEAEKERFRLGVGNILDLNRVNAAYVEALSTKAQADYQIIFQKAALEYYKGTLQQS